VSCTSDTASRELISTLEIAGPVWRYLILQFSRTHPGNRVYDVIDQVGLTYSLPCQQLISLTSICIPEFRVRGREVEIGDRTVLVRMKFYVRKHACS